jgi:hypothetical protein
MSFARAFASRDHAPDAELLAPARHPGKVQPTAHRDLVEDADFEVIQQAADSDVLDLLSSAPPVRADRETMTRMRERLATPPNGNERLGLFSATPGASPPSPRKAGYVVPAAFGILLFACGVLFLAGGLFTAPAGPDPMTTAAIPVKPAVEAPAAPAAAAAVVPVRPSPSISVISTGSAGSIEVIASKPRPARIERAGSIMMIRSGN